MNFSTLIKNNEKTSLVLALGITALAVVLFVVGFSEAFQWCEVTAKVTAKYFPEGHVVGCVVAFIAGAWICRRFAPEASGNGVLKVRNTLDILETAPREQVSAVLGFRLLMTKSVAASVCALGGGAMGREGPIVHLSAAIFWIFGDRFKKVLPSINLRHWVICGGAAGFGVAFNAPLAAVAFAAEELNDTYLSHGKIATLWVTLFACLGHVALFENALFFPVAPFHSEPWGKLLPYIIITALLCGLLAAIFQGAVKLLQQRVFHKTPFWVTAGLCGLTVGTIGAALGGQTIGGGVITTQLLLQNTIAPLTTGDVLGRFVNTILTASSGNAGGLVAPSIGMGAGVGSVVGQLMHIPDPKILMLCGMAAFLSAMLHIPLTAAIVIFETTGHSTLILPFLLSSLLGNFVGAGLSKALSRQTKKDK
jgi:H+/Cl- antiporter ClcA